MKRRSFWWVGIVAIALALSVLLSNAWQVGWEAAPVNSFSIAQETPEAEAPAETALPIAGSYEDPQGNFQVGLLEGYITNSAAGSPLFQSGDGSLAYSVIRVPLNNETPLSEIGLVEIAQQTLGQGEGFQTRTFNTVPEGGLQIDWIGRLSQGSAPPKPVSGTILAKQQGLAVYLLVVAALDEAVDQVPAAISTLADTLIIL
ncbi:MAG: hypothetical protein AAGE59_11090 [Cyanobacteria bacterium P01_F01_bin.86]